MHVRLLCRTLFIIGLAISLQSCGGGSIVSVPLTAGSAGQINPLTTYTVYVGSAPTVGNITTIVPFAAGAPPDNLSGPVIAPNATILYPDGSIQTADALGNFDVSQSSYVKAQSTAISSDPGNAVEVYVMPATGAGSYQPDDQFVDAFEPSAGLGPSATARSASGRRRSAAAPPSSLAGLVVRPGFIGVTSVQRANFHAIGYNTSAMRVPLGGVSINWSVGKPAGCSPSAGAGSLETVAGDPSKVVYVPPLTATFPTGCPDLVIASTTVNGATITASGQAFYRAVAVLVKISGTLVDFSGAPVPRALIDLYGNGQESAASFTPGKDGVVTTSTGGAWSAFVVAGKNLTPVAMIVPTSGSAQIVQLTPQSIPITGPATGIAFTTGVNPASPFSEYPVPAYSCGNIGQNPNCGGAASPFNIVAGSDGALWFTTAASVNCCGGASFGALYRVARDGSMTSYNTFQAPGYDIVSASDQNLWYTTYPPGGSYNLLNFMTTGGPGSYLYWGAADGGAATPALSHSPGGITMGSGNAVWFTFPDAGEIGGVTASVTNQGNGFYYVSAGPSPTFALSANSKPLGITKGPDAAVWFAENQANKIGRLIPSVDAQGGVSFSGLTEYSLPTANSQPFRITSGSDGALWFTENNANRVGRVTTAGTITEYSFSAGNVGYGITLGADGAIWFAESGSAGDKLGRVTTSGTITEVTVPTANAGVYGITVGPDRAIWFTEKNALKIGRYAP
jgi:virginiamycin B lyase